MALPLINGINYSSANVNIIIPLLGVAIGVTKISYSKEKTIEDNYALGPDPVSRGFGQNRYTGQISMYKDLYNRIIDLSPDKDPTNLPPFDITVTFGGNTAPFRKETLRAVSFKNVPMSVSSGDTKIPVDIDLAIGNIDFA